MWTPEAWYNEGRTFGERSRQYLLDWAAMILNSYRAELPDWSDAKITSALVTTQAERLASVPDFKRYPELRGMRDLIEAKRQGLREGANLTEDQAALYFDGHFFLHRYVQGNRMQRFAANCSCAYFPTSEAGPLFGNNLDTTPAEPFGPPDPIAGEHLLMGGVSSGVPMDEESPDIFPAPVHQLVQRYCRSTDEAVEMFARYKTMWGPGNMIVVDRESRVAMIEKSAMRIAVRHSPDGFGFTTAMVQVDPDMKAFVHDRRMTWLKSRGMSTTDSDDIVYWRTQDQRQQLMEQLLDEARQNPNVTAMQRMMQFRDEKRGKCAGNGEPIRPGVEGTGCYEHTVRTIVWLLAQNKAKWWARDHATGKPSWDNPMADVTFQHGWTW